MNIQNETLLNPKVGDPNGYVTKDGMWAAVPFGKKFIIINNGQQVHIVNNYSAAKSYIDKEVKSSKKPTSKPRSKPKSKVKGSAASLDKFLT